MSHPTYFLHGQILEMNLFINSPVRFDMEVNDSGEDEATQDTVISAPITVDDRPHKPQSYCHTDAFQTARHASESSELGAVRVKSSASDPTQYLTRSVAPPTHRSGRPRASQVWTCAPLSASPSHIRHEGFPITAPTPLFLSANNLRMKPLARS